MSESLEQTAHRELSLDVCLCGAGKRVRESFCRQCYYALPERLRRRLYDAFSDGYAEHYDEARDFLKIETDRIKR